MGSNPGIAQPVISVGSDPLPNIQRHVLHVVAGVVKKRHYKFDKRVYFKFCSTTCVSPVYKHTVFDQVAQCSHLVIDRSFQKCRKMSPVYQHRQQPFNCGCVVFHRSQRTAGGTNKPFLVAVCGLQGWKTICDYNAWYVAWRGSYCTHVTRHRGTLKVC